MDPLDIFKKKKGCRVERLASSTTVLPYILYVSDLQWDPGMFSTTPGLPTPALCFIWALLWNPGWWAADPIWFPDPQC